MISANSVLCDKTSGNITGSRRSFSCRILKGTTLPHTPKTLITNNPSTAINNNCGYRLSDNEYQVVHFVGHIKYDISFNFNDHNNDVLNDSGNRNYEQLAPKARIKHFTQSATSIQSQNSFELNKTSNTQNYFLIIFGQIKEQINTKISEFISRHDVDGNYIFVEPRYHNLKY